MMPTTSEHPARHPVDGLLAHAVVDPADLLADAQLVHAHRRRQRALAGVAAFVVFAMIAVFAAQAGFSGTPAAAGSAPVVAANAEAVGVLVIRPGSAPERVAAATPVVGASARELRSTAAWRLEGIATVERASTEGTVAIADRRSSASASAERIDLFDGRITLEAAGIQAEASSTADRASGSVTLSSATRLLVDGVEVPAPANRQVALQGIGTVLVNEQAVLSSAPVGDAQTGPRHRVVGAIAHVRLTRATAGLPAGSEIIIGRVDAGVREGKVIEVAHPGPDANPAPTAPPLAPAPSATAGLQPGVPAPGQGALPRRASAVRGSEVAAAAAGSLQGYQFPVLGRHDYSDTWGAPRASTGIPHQGTDIFAAEGTPVVALTDGVLDRVGWNSIGGYRFWLFDAYGNSFYYAHLSAYSPIAQDGARVRRGDVIAFVGNTGDARGTPPHVHFEVHPGNGEPVNPVAFLDAWKQGIAVAIGLASGTGDDKVAPLSLFGFTDIAPNSGLSGSVLDSVPDTTARPIDQENSPVDTADSLTGAIEGPGTSATK